MDIDAISTEQHAVFYFCNCTDSSNALRSLLYVKLLSFNNEKGILCELLFFYILKANTGCVRLHKERSNIKSAGEHAALCGREQV